MIPLETYREYKAISVLQAVQPDEVYELFRDLDVPGVEIGLGYKSYELPAVWELL